jgi:nucleotide-binding universal stress UspA family protein
MNEIVIGVDGSVSAARALDWAIGEAVLRGATLRAVYVYDAARVPRGQPVPSDVDLRASAKQLLDEAVDAALERAAAAPPQVLREVVAVSDRGPAPALIAAAHKADLLVVGNRGLDGVAALLAHSVSDEVADHAPCPVVVVPVSARRPLAGAPS